MTIYVALKQTKTNLVDLFISNKIMPPNMYITERIGYRTSILHELIRQKLWCLFDKFLKIYDCGSGGEQIKFDLKDGN